MPASSLLWPDARVKPPFGSVAVDWGHPLALGLRSLYLINVGAGNRLFDLAGLDGEMTTLTGSQVATPSGLALNVTTAAGRAEVLNTAYLPQTSLLALVTPNVTDPQTVLARHTADGDPSDYWWRFAGGALKIDIPWVVGNVVVSGAITLTAERRYGLGFTRSGSTGSWNWAQYIDGVLNGSASADSNNPNTGTHKFHLGLRTDSDTSDVGNMKFHVVARYARALTANEVAWWTTEPYAMLRPILRRRYFVAPAAAADGAKRHYYSQMMRA